MSGEGEREHVDATPDLPEEEDVFDDEGGLRVDRKPVDPDDEPELPPLHHRDDPDDEPKPPSRHPHHNQYVKYIRAPHPDYRDRVNPFE